MVDEDNTEKFETDDFERIRANLEARLNAVSTLDTEIPEFLAVTAKIRYWSWEPLSHPAVRDIYEHLLKARHERRSLLTRSEKLLETNVSHALMNAYLKEKINTVGDLKEGIENFGPIYIDKFGLKGIAYFNEFLKKCGLEPIGVVRSGYSDETLATRYGLYPPKR